MSLRSVYLCSSRPSFSRERTFSGFSRFFVDGWLSMLMLNVECFECFGRKREGGKRRRGEEKEGYIGVKVMYRRWREENLGVSTFIYNRV